MHWARKNKTKVRDTAIPYERLFEGSMKDKSVAKGCVPVLVGRGEGEERVMVPVKLLKMPCVKELLDIAAMEFGYSQEGVLRIPCEVEKFRMVMTMASSSSKGR